MLSIFFLLFILKMSFAATLPEKCDCRDWYGNCRSQSENWIDDDTWAYSCMNNN
uniref:Uncharacterized protein n=1 Tax=Acrobeloides nanus TaxID=290746 RepID=A0A914CZ24_9BILA